MEGSPIYAAKGKRMNKILIIDDEEDFGYFVKLNLQSSNEYCVSVATDGMAGLKIAEETRPNVILLDIMMPKMSGLQVLRRLRAEKATRNIPVIMLTAMRDHDSIVEAMESSSEMYIVKPIEMEALNYKIQSVMKSHMLGNAPKIS